ncbi:hypothetical protein NHX12_008236, partial [Muraenolepis orangiensis]
VPRSGAVPGATPWSTELDCWRCGQNGHRQQECPLLEVAHLHEGTLLLPVSVWWFRVPRSGAVPGVTPWSTELDCWRCGQNGHRQQQYPLMEVGQVVQVSAPNQEARLSWRQRLHRSLN